MSDTRRHGGARDGRKNWCRDAAAWMSRERGERFKRALRRGHRGDVVRRGWNGDTATRRDNNRRRRAADKVTIRGAVADMIGEEEELALWALEC